MNSSEIIFFYATQNVRTCATEPASSPRIGDALPISLYIVRDDAGGDNIGLISVYSSKTWGRI